MQMIKNIRVSNPAIGEKVAYILKMGTTETIRAVTSAIISKFCNDG